MSRTRVDYGRSIQFENGDILSEFCIGCGEQRRIGFTGAACEKCHNTGTYYKVKQANPAILEPVHDYGVQEV